MRSIGIPVLALLVLPTGWSSPVAQELNIIEQFEDDVARERWDDALPLIEEIIRRDPTIAVSWRNYGVVLGEMERHADAATAFRRAYELDPQDYGAQYRVFLSLALANDARGFIDFADKEATGDPDLIARILEADEFSEITALPAFEELVKKYRD